MVWSPAELARQTSTLVAANSTIPHPLATTSASTVRRASSCTHSSAISPTTSAPHCWSGQGERAGHPGGRSELTLADTHTGCPPTGLCPTSPSGEFSGAGLRAPGCNGHRPEHLHELRPARRQLDTHHQSEAPLKRADRNFAELLQASRSRGCGSPNHASRSSGHCTPVCARRRVGGNLDAIHGPGVDSIPCRDGPGRPDDNSSPQAHAILAVDLAHVDTVCVDRRPPVTSR